LYFQEHNCVRELRSLMQAQQSKLVEVQAEVAEGKFQMSEQKRELQLLKDYMLAMRNANPSLRILADQMEADEVRRWAETLPKARVLRWGGMISTPDTVLQVISYSWRAQYIQSNTITFQSCRQ
jgi:E3 ubiquitin-protein ligase NRDP1